MHLHKKISSPKELALTPQSLLVVTGRRYLKTPHSTCRTENLTVNATGTSVLLCWQPGHGTCVRQGPCFRQSQRHLQLDVRPTTPKDFHPVAQTPAAYFIIACHCGSSRLSPPRVECFMEASGAKQPSVAACGSRSPVWWAASSAPPATEGTYIFWQVLSMPE